LAHRVEAHGHFSQSGGARPQAAAAILVDLAEVDAETPTGTRRRLGQSLEKPWLSGAELKVRIQLPPPVSQANFRIAPLAHPDLVERQPEL